MLTSEHTAELLVALLKARANFQSIAKTKHVSVTTKTGRSYSFDYAPLEGIQAATEPALSAEGLLLCSGVVPGPDGTVEVVTRLWHTSEQWMESRIPWGTFEDMKALGGFVSYARRYNHVALLDLAGEEDVDGSQSTGDHMEPRTKAVATPAAATNGHGHPPTPEPPKGTPKNLVQKSGLLQQVQTELSRLGCQDAAAIPLYRLAFGEEVDTWDLVCGESLHTLKHGLSYLKTLNPEAPDANTPQDTPAPTTKAAPTAEGLPVDPSPAGSSSAAPDPEADATERDRQRLRAEVTSWDLRVPPAEVEHVIQHNPYSKARALLWKCRRQDSAA